MNSEDTRNIILFVVLSAFILIGWNFIFPQKARPPVTTNAPVAAGTPIPAANSASGPQGLAQPAEALKPREEAISQAPRVKLDTPDLGGSINLQGGALDDVVLKHYRQTIDKSSPDVVLFSPDGTAAPYWAVTGFVAADKAIKTPTLTTRWTADGGDLTPSHPATLTWDNGEGLVFTRRIAVDDKYMFTVDDSVENKTDKPVSLRPYGLILRRGAPKVSGYSVHEGFVAYANDGEQKDTYAGIDKETDKTKVMKTTGGWFGFTDRYWAAAIIPGQTEAVDARFAATGAPPREDYQSDFLAPLVDVAPGASAAQQTRVFAGALEVGTLDDYIAKLGIKKLDLLIDWGRLYFITKPMFYLIDFLYKFIGNFGLAILAVTVIVKAVFFPLANKSYRSMAKMKLIQPKLAALKEQYPGDQQKFQQAQMALMKAEGVNPVAGCLPVLPQIPVFISLYSVFSITLEMRHQPFYGWIKDLSVPDPTNVFTAFGLIPFDPTIIPVFGPFLHLGVWPLAMGLTMFLQMKMQPEPTDPTQKMMFMYMPVVFTFMFGSLPAGLVIYYAWNNLLTLLQQSIIMKSAGNRIELFDNLRNMFKRKPA
jgi:YidC/Oxa1 family membrane protein insertase